MKILFTRRRHLGSLIIRMVTWSAYSHVDFILDEERVLGATAPNGVNVEPIRNRLAKASKAVVMEINDVDLDKAKEFAIAQLGKKYDWTNIIGIYLHRDWQDSDSWSCAELIAAILKHSGVQLFDIKFYHRVTPQHLLMLNYKKERIK